METRPHHSASALPSFALAAVHEVQKVAQMVSKVLGDSGEPEPFLTTLGPLLSDVAARLEALVQPGCPKGSDAEKRVFKLLVVLETLVRVS